MSPWLQIGLAAVGLALVFSNAITTRRLWSSSAFERSQKIAQTLLVWLVPGAFVIVHHFVGEQDHEATTKDATVGTEGSCDACSLVGSGGHDGGSHD